MSGCGNHTVTPTDRGIMGHGMVATAWRHYRTSRECARPHRPISRSRSPVVLCLRGAAADAGPQPALMLRSCRKRVVPTRSLARRKAARSRETSACSRIGRSNIPDRVCVPVRTWSCKGTYLMALLPMPSPALRMHLCLMTRAKMLRAVTQPVRAQSATIATVESARARASASPSFELAFAWYVRAHARARVAWSRGEWWRCCRCRRQPSADAHATWRACKRRAQLNGKCRSKLACCATSPETAISGAPVPRETRGAGLALEPGTSTSHHGRAQKERGFSPAQHPSKWYAPNTTKAARRARTESSIVTPSPQR
jgi:hypothetical protein